MKIALLEDWIRHVSHCDNCRGYPELCERGKQLHQALWPKDWKEGKPARKDSISHNTPFKQ